MSTEFSEGFRSMMDRIVERVSHVKCVDPASCEMRELIEQIVDEIIREYGFDFAVGASAWREELLQMRKVLLA